MERAAACRTLLARGWLASQPPDFQAALLARATLVAFRAGEPVFHAQDRPGGIYGIADGAIAVLVAAERRAPRLAHVLRCGIWFGHGPLFGGGTRKLGFRAMEAAVMMHVPLQALDDLAQASITGARALGSLANSNMDVAIAAVTDLLIPRAEQRIAATLLRVTGVTARVRQGEPRGYRMTQADLAEMANASRQVVNQTLAGFASKGWVGLGYQQITILNSLALAQLAEASDGR
jgi:CRP-like cAMP-binding protein